MLRNRMVAYQMGAMRLSGLVGNVTIPKQTVGATAYWLASETTGITEGNQTFAQLALTPRTVGAYTQISRLLQLQSSPDAESLILSDLAKQVAIAADLAVLYGTGTEQPTGITQTASIGTLASGSSFDMADILEFQTDVAANNALNASFGYVTTPAVAALCLTRPTFTGSVDAIWKGSVLDGMMGGFKAMASNQMTAATMLAGIVGYLRRRRVGRARAGRQSERQLRARSHRAARDVHDGRGREVCRRLVLRHVVDLSRDGDALGEQCARRRERCRRTGYGKPIHQGRPSVLVRRQAAFRGNRPRGSRRRRCRAGRDGQGYEVRTAAETGAAGRTAEG
ncbi:MAG: phage major capsid protein [Betaproteobacteria bacterium]|nr:phage major capsid protein [Betaproteobacteria bacterium]